jgi:16S rRNA (guanine966-N2)-methyltransferase
MRITGGEYRGRMLESPKDRAIRPTSDKVRQAVFNMLESRGVIQNAAVLDAFCGTGALGLEALSRGALCCTFMDKNPSSLDLCRRNFAALKIDAQYSFVLKDAAKPGMKPDNVVEASLVFLDPPYRQGLLQQSLPALKDGGWIALEAFLVLEAEAGFDPAVLAEMEVELIRDYGETRIILARS